MTSRVLIATLLDDAPDRASVAYGYHDAMHAFRRDGAIMVPAEIAYPGDVTRTRATIAAWALERSDWDWILWWDSDVVPRDPGVVARMLARAESDGHDWIGAPYPRKRLPTLLPFHMLDEDWREGRMPIRNDCVEVAALAIGFTLTHRKAIERLTEAHREELWFTDTTNTVTLREAVGFFDTLYTAPRVVQGRRYREKLSEDYSACARHRALGGSVQMYVGEGSPLAHVGPHAFTGTVAEAVRNLHEQAIKR